MTQNASNMDAGRVPTPSRPVLRRLALLLAGGTCAFALAVPLSSRGALAQGWQVTVRETPNGAVWTERWINPEFGGIQQLRRGSTPGNNCPVPAFEVLNPKPGELRCVGYVAPW